MKIITLLMSLFLVSCQSNFSQEEHLGKLIVQTNKVYQNLSELPTELNSISMFGYLISEQYRNMLLKVSPKDISRFINKYPQVKSDLENRNQSSIFYQEPAFLLIGVLIERDSEYVYKNWFGYENDLKQVYRAMNKPMPNELVF